MKHVYICEILTPDPEREGAWDISDYSSIFALRSDAVKFARKFASDAQSKNYKIYPSGDVVAWIYYRGISGRLSMCIRKREITKY